MHGYYANKPADFKRITTAFFDLNNTLFDTSTVPQETLEAYGKHVQRLFHNGRAYEPFTFDEQWMNMKPWPDVVTGIGDLQGEGIACVTLTNLPPRIVAEISHEAGIYWDVITDLQCVPCYKPDTRAYDHALGVMGRDPRNCMMVTANEYFGDLSGASATCMLPVLIDRKYKYSGDVPQSIIELANLVSRRFSDAT